jgi:uncharacterized protein (DUF58 family)
LTSQLSPHRGVLLLAVPWLFFLALAFRSSGLLVMAAAWTLVLLVARGDARRALQGLTVRREVYPSAFEGDAVSVSLVLENRSGHGAYLVEIDDAFGPSVADRQRALEPGTLAHARRRRLRYQTICSRPWGIYAVGPLALRTTDPLGLFSHEDVVGAVEPFAVFPRVHDLGGLERLGARASLTPQDVALARAGQSPLYLGVRDYRAGDDVRRIHWPATARRGAPAVKEFEVDLTPYFTLFLDLHRRHRAGTGLKSTLEYVVRTAASLIWTATRQSHVVQVHAEGTRTLFLPPGRGQLHLAHCLYELIRLREDGQAALLDVVERHGAQLPEGSTAALVLGTIAVDVVALEELLESFRARGVRPVLVFVDSDTFIPIDKWALPRQQAIEQREALAGLLRGRRVPAAILGADDDLAETLGRPDLFERLA